MLVVADTVGAVFVGDNLSIYVISFDVDVATEPFDNILAYTVAFLSTSKSPIYSNQPLSVPFLYNILSFLYNYLVHLNKYLLNILFLYHIHIILYNKKLYIYQE